MLGNHNHYFYECTRAKPITAETVDQLGRALLAAKAEQERAISLAEDAAASLAPIAHYRKVDARACRTIMNALPTVRVFIYRRPAMYGKDFRQVSVTRRDAHFTQVWVNLIGDACTVADLVAQLRACETYRKELARVANQFSELEEMMGLRPHFVIEAEERIRALVQEIEQTRDQVAERLLGASPSYYHDAVRNYMPGLAGRD